MPFTRTPLGANSVAIERTRFSTPARAAEVAKLLGLLRAELESSARAIDSLTVVAGLSSLLPEQLAPGVQRLDRSLRAPLLLELPSRVNGARRSDGAASLVDLAGALRRAPAGALAKGGP